MPPLAAPADAPPLPWPAPLEVPPELTGLPVPPLALIPPLAFEVPPRLGDVLPPLVGFSVVPPPFTVPPLLEVPPAVLVPPLLLAPPLVGIPPVFSGELELPLEEHATRERAVSDTARLNFQGMANWGRGELPVTQVAWA